MIAIERKHNKALASSVSLTVLCPTSSSGSGTGTIHGSTVFCSSNRMKIAKQMQLQFLNMFTEISVELISLVPVKAMIDETLLL